VKILAPAGRVELRKNGNNREKNEIAICAK
jgi:hypothetical protein